MPFGEFVGRRPGRRYPAGNALPFRLRHTSLLFWSGNLEWRKELAGVGDCREIKEVPLDARLFGFHQNAESHLLGLWLRKRVGGELVRERRLMVFVVGARRLEVDHGQAVVHLAHEVDDTDEGSVERRDAQLELALDA